MAGVTKAHGQANARSDSKSSKFTFRHSFARSTHRILREGSSGKIKMCVSLQRRAIQNVKMYVSLQRRAQNCMKQAHGVGSHPRHRKIIALPQFRTSDHHEVTKGLHRRRKNLHFTTVLDVRRARSDERVARRPREFAFHHSFGRPTITFCVKGCFGELKNLDFTTVLAVRRARSDEKKICISPQFWPSDEHEVTRGLLRQSRKFAFHHSFGRPTMTFCVKGRFGNVINLHFTTVLGVRRARSDERVVSRRDLPNLPCGKEKK